MSNFDFRRSGLKWGDIGGLPKDHTKHIIDQQATRVWAYRQD